MYVLHLIWLDISFIFVSEAELRYIRFKFLAAILVAILENMQLLLLISTYLNSTSFISYESTLYSSIYLKAKLRYIRLAAILKNMQLLLFISTNLNSTSFTLYEQTLHSFLYLKAELRCIRFRFSAAILSTILKIFILSILDNTQQYSTNRKALKSNFYFPLYFVSDRSNISIKDWPPYWPPSWKIINGWYWNLSHSICRQKKLQKK